ncbi:MAG: restriction endonuclease subunit S [Anaerolineae bacterium]|nr:restriction endonuclease subunit S [Anaerolineae bacterium]
MQPLKYVATINDEALGEDVAPDYELQYIDIGNVDSSGLINEVVRYNFENAPSRARRIVQDGDVIISTVRTYLQAIAPIKSPPDNLVVSTGFAVIRPYVDKLEAEYCKYALREPNFLNEVVARSTGINYPAIKSSELGNIFIYVPTLTQQRAIAAYLDRETAKLDTLSARLERLLDLLAEKRQALIYHAVTRGLNPDVPLRDSGVEWLGEIPVHWEIEYAQWLFNEINERSITGEEELLTVSHLTGVTPRAEKDVNMFMAESLEGYKICQAGDLVINTLWAWMGAMGVAFQPGLVSPSYHVYRPRNTYEPRYLDYLVRIPHFATEVIRYSKGVWSSRLRLYPSEFFKLLLPVPPLEEQREIADYLERKITTINTLHSTIQKAIALFQERRTSLIAAAVSGKMEISR